MVILEVKPPFVKGVCILTQVRVDFSEEVFNVQSFCKICVLNFYCESSRHGLLKFECLMTNRATFDTHVGNCIQRGVGSDSKYANYLMNQPCNPEHTINGEITMAKNGEETRLKTPKNSGKAASIRPHIISRHTPTY